MAEMPARIWSRLRGSRVWRWPMWSWREVWRPLLTTTLPILASALFLWATLRNDNSLQRSETRSRAEAQAKQAMETFRLEAARFVMGEETCADALAKAALLKSLFPEELPEDFAAPVVRAYSEPRIEGDEVVYRAAPGCPSPKPGPVEDIFGGTFQQNFAAGG